MSRARDSKRRELPKFLPAMGVFLALVGAGILPAPAYAACSAVGSNVTCSGAANPLAPSYANGANNLNVTVNNGATLGVLLGVGGNVMTLTGANNTLTNNGQIDVTTLGTGLGVLSSGVVMGNASASTQTIVNNGVIRGSSGVAVALTGMALAVQNGPGGTTNITNTGLISTAGILGATLVGPDAGVLVVYGGGQVNIDNSGTINGRIALDSAAGGNTFTNSGTINGSVSMGRNSTNHFIATTGSSVTAAGGTALQANLGIGATTLTFAATGFVDGGAGGDNTLSLQQGSEATGSIDNSRYINFNHLDVQSGFWTLSGASGATDATLGNGTTAVIDNAASLGTGSIVSNGGAIQASVSGLTLSNAISLTGSGLTVGGTANLGLSGTLSGSGALTQAGTGTLLLSGANNYTGGTDMQSGTVTVGNNAALGSGSVTVSGSATLDSSQSVVVTNQIAVNTGATLTLGGSNALQLGSVISGDGSVAKNGLATVTLTAANTYTGPTTINSGTLALSAGGSLAATAAVNLAGGAAGFDISGANANQTIGSLSGVAGSTITLGANALRFGGATDQSFGGTIGGTGGILKMGSGTQTLTAANTYTGVTTISAGRLALGVGGSLAAASAVVLDTFGASFDISGAGANQAIGGLSGVSGTTVTLGANTLTFGDADNHTFGGWISGSGGIVKQGSGTETLTGALTYFGGTTINEGTLAIGGSGSLSGIGAVNLANAGARFDLSGASAPLTIGALAGATGSGVVLGPNGLAFGDAGNHTFGGTIGGTGGVVKQGSGTETLTGTNTYTGGTTIIGGTLALGAGGSLSDSGAVNLGAPGARLDISTAGANQTIGALAGVAGTTVALGANVLSFGDASDQTFGGAISGTGGITKQGSGIARLTGASTYTGTTTISAGTLALGTGGALAAGGAVDLDTSSARFDISDSGASQTIGALSGVSGTTVTLGANTLSFGGASDQTFGGAIEGTGGVVKQGSGTATLTGANTYSGGTTINAGTLALGAGGSLLGTGAVDLANAGATLDLGGANAPQTIGALTGVAGASVMLGANGLAFGGSGSHTFGGTIGGTGGIVKQGSGTETLTGANTYTGGTTISAGTLALGTGGSLAAGGAVNLSASGASLNISGAGADQTLGALSGVAGTTVSLGANMLSFGDATDQTFNGTITGTAGIVKQGAGSQTLGADNTYSGGTTLMDGTLVVGSNGALGTGALTVSGPASLEAATAVTLANDVVLDSTATLDGSQDLTLAGVVSGGGALVKNGAATLTLSGINTFSGGATLNAGTLTVGNAQSLGLGELTVNGGRLSLGATELTVTSLDGMTGGTIDLGTGNLNISGGGAYSGVLTGAGSLIKSGIDTLTLLGENLYTGGTRVAQGTLSVGYLGTGSVLGNLNVSSGATLAGSGTVGQGGTVIIESGGHLAPGNSIGTLNVAGNLDLNPGAILDFEFGRPGASGNAASATNDRVAVTGNLTLDGTLNIAQSGAPADGTYNVGYYRLMTYGGTLVDNGVSIGTRPVGSNANLAVLAEGGNVDLRVGALGDDTLQTWQGGSGAWNASDLSWLNDAGELPQAWAGNHAVFDGTGGTVTVAGTQSFKSLQFRNGDYILAAPVGTGALDTVAAGSELRVLYGASAEISAPITGPGAVSLTGGGTLTLSGANTYTGGTRIDVGVLQISSDANLGAATGSVALGASILSTTADIDSARAVNLTSNGMLAQAENTTLTLSGMVTGQNLIKIGAGTLRLTGPNSYLGTLVADGTLIGNAASISGDIGNGATVVFDQASDADFARNIGAFGSTAGHMVKRGAGILSLLGGSTLDWTVEAGTLASQLGTQPGGGAAPLALHGGALDIDAGAAFVAQQTAVNRSYAGTLSGAGSFTKTGAGSLTYTGDASGFSGSTAVQAGALILGSDGVRWGGTMNVASGATLGGVGTVGSANSEVVIGAGAHLAPGAQVGVLRVAGDLTLNETAIVDVSLGSPGTAASPSAGRSGRIVVDGDLVLDGTLTLAQSTASADGTAALGYYRLATYAGALTDLGLDIGTTPAIGNATYRIQTGNNRVDLFVGATGDQSLQAWQGGNGVWNTSDQVWINDGGQVPMAWAGGHAVFGNGSAAGTVQVQGNVAIDGIQFVDDGYVLAGNGALDVGAAGAEVRVLADGATIATRIAGAGALTKTEAGTLVLSGQNTYEGGTRVQGGVLRIGSDANLGASTGEVRLAGGTLSVSDSLQTSRVLTVSGTGALDVDDGALLQWRGDWAGQGTLAKTGAGSLMHQGNSSLDLDIAAGRFIAAGSLAGSVAVGSGATLELQSPDSQTLTAAVSGAGSLLKSGTGNVLYNGDGSAFTGNTVVQAGRFSVGSAGSGAVLGGTLQVMSGATLGGSGRIGSTTLAAGATVAPGNSIGTLSVAGDFTFDPASRYEVEVDPGGTDSDLLRATGAVALNGAAVQHVGLNGSYRPDATYTIVSADGGLSGTFGSVSSDYAFLAPSLSYDASNAYLRLVRNDVAFDRLAQTGNQRAVARGAESTGIGSPVYDAIVTQTGDAASIRRAYDQLSGEIHASLRSALLDETQFARGAVNDRLRTAFGLPGAATAPVTAYGDGNAQAAPADARGLVGWAQAYGGWGSLDGQAGQGSSKLDRSAGGVFMGADASVGGNWRVGAMAGYGSSSLKAESLGAKANVDNYTVGVYAGTQADRLGLRLGATQTWHHVDTRRGIDVAGLTDGAKASYRGSTAQVFGEASYALQTGPVSVEPFAGLAYANQRMRGYDEDGTAGLKGKKDSDGTLFSTLGARVSGQFTLGGADATAHGALGWRHAYGSVRPTVTQAFDGGNDFTVAGTPIARDAALVEAGLDLRVGRNTTVGVAYQGQLGDGARQHGVKAQVSVRF
ncbi:autotransporter [Bordetella ansorpii]|uniref:Autotransporter n=1 Tax=Bordetella ansorpii TaxID=288768 RepID=A0A157M850_9BORD|nr:autotransporter-associated beta strand repeat-containing protein [Bordetella ansorpii]SAI05168.1 autotransporter [Bordetella ansorpii]